jgi:AbrB family looped-hinge helix DNA binding protein
MTGHTTVRNKGQVTIPADIRRAIGLEEGDPVEVEVVEGGILLRPQKVIDATQAWFWSSAWQESIRRSVEQIEAGKGVVSDDDETFLTSLDAE